MFRNIVVGALIIFAVMTIFFWRHMTSEVGSPMASFREYEVEHKKSVSNDATVHTLEAEVLKIYMSSMSHAAIDVRFINTSPNDLKNWAITLEAYDKDGQYLAKGEAMASHMRPGDSIVHDVFLSHTKASDIASLNISLYAVVGYSGRREDTNYNLTWRVNPGQLGGPE